jgi:hypothetical protein
MPFYPDDHTTETNEKRKNCANLSCAIALNRVEWSWLLGADAYSVVYAGSIQKGGLTDFSFTGKVAS